MSDENFQNDLFGDDSVLKRGKKKPLTGKYSKKQLLPYIKLPAEYLVIASICVLVLMVLIFALGVEKGKKEAFLSDTRNRVEEKEAAKQEDPLDTGEGLEGSRTGTSTEVESVDLEEAEPEPVEVQDPVALERPEDKGRYIVQLASFRDKNVAEREADNLREKGYSIEIQKKSNWYQIQAYGFSDFSEADKAKKEFEKHFADCFIKERE